jgi:hypothetical protein
LPITWHLIDAKQSLGIVLPAQRCMSRWWARNEGDGTKNTAKASTAASAVS